jgi:transcriptional regulator of acetoin/glycerol metabolism
MRPAIGDAGNESVTTLEERSARRLVATPEPGLVAVFARGRAQLELVPLNGDTVVLGRAHGETLSDDTLASRHHAEVSLRDGVWQVRDLGSRNGTFVDGERIEGEPGLPVRGRTLVLRIGATLYLGVDDLGPYRTFGVREHNGAVVGPRLAEALERVQEAGAGDGSVLVLGESGAGKELAARSFHAAGGRGERPFVAVNCAAIPDGVAERLLFGSVRGAFSGATDAQGYIQAAHGGTLFLDEVGELAPAVQPKLLRVLETGELLPLGATRPVRVTTRFCFATLRNLRTLLQQQRFRADLFYRIARTTVTLPPLRERADEIATLVMRELAQAGGELSAHASLIEACLLRPWSGNVRELQSAVRYAVAEARRDGQAEVRATHLPPLEAALGIVPEEAPAPSLPAAVDPDSVTPEALRAALAAHRGNLAAAARALGLHRSQLYRLLDQHGIAHDD